MNDVIKALRPIKRRIRRNRLLSGAASGLAAGLLAAVMLQIAALFIPVADRGLWAAVLAGSILTVTALVNTLRPVKNKEAAETADSCGLEERAVTALEDPPGPAGPLQRTDACKALQSLNIKLIRPGSMKKTLTAALGCGLLLGGLLLIPNPQDTKAAAHKAFTRTIQEGREAIQKASEKDEEVLTEEKRNELRRITGDLNRDLANSRDAADAMIALDRAEQRLEQMHRQTARDTMDASGYSADSLMGERNEGTEGYTADQNTAANESYISDRQHGNSVTENSPAGVQLQMLQAMAAMKNAVNPSSGQRPAALAGMQGNRSGAGTTGTTGAGNQSSGPQTGGGAGEGSTNEEQTAGNGPAGHTLTKGSRDPHYQETEYETLYDPEHIGQTKQNVMTEQNRLGNDDPILTETGPGRGTADGDVPWNEVLKDYADTEARSADRENLTVQERQWVNEYYALLTEQQ